jgi:hypothetical protein
VKNQNGKYGGYSPTQWLTGRTHNFLDKDDMNPVSEEGLPGLEAHLNQRAKIAAVFDQAEANTILEQAVRARERHVVEPAVGQIVYFFRKGKGSKPIRCRGPARVAIVEKRVLHREERRP